jgi:hypothetical protein
LAQEKRRWCLDKLETEVSKNVIEDVRITSILFFTRIVFLHIRGACHRQLGSRIINITLVLCFLFFCVDRYHVLFGSKELKYYEARGTGPTGAGSPLGVLDLATATRVSQLPVDPAHGRFGFQIETPGRVWQYHPDDADTRDSWLDRINRLIHPEQYAAEPNPIPKPVPNAVPLAEQKADDAGVITLVENPLVAPAVMAVAAATAGAAPTADGGVSTSPSALAPTAVTPNANSVITVRLLPLLRIGMSFQFIFF